MIEADIAKNIPNHAQTENNPDVEISLRSEKCGNHRRKRPFKKHQNEHQGISPKMNEMNDLLGSGVKHKALSLRAQRSNPMIYKMARDCRGRYAPSQ
jgi:hypothetical protein